MLPPFLNTVSERTPRRLLWGIAPTGPIHLGYAAHLLVLHLARSRGTEPVLLVANYHGYLDTGKSGWAELEARSQDYARTVRRAGLGDAVIFSRDAYRSSGYFEALLRLSPALVLGRALEAAGTTLGPDRAAPVLSEALYVATQVLDPWFLKCDAVLCGMDEQPLYEYGLPLLAATFQFPCLGLYLPMCPGLASAEMHASSPSSNMIELFMSLDGIRACLEQAVRTDPARLIRWDGYARTVLWPLLAAIDPALAKPPGSAGIAAVLGAIAATQHVLLTGGSRA